MDAVSLVGMRRRRSVIQGRRDESGETLALLVVWPALLTAILLMLVHAFIVTNARAEAELAASQGLRSAWRAAAESDFLTEPGSTRRCHTPAPSRILRCWPWPKRPRTRWPGRLPPSRAGAGGVPAQPSCTATGAIPTRRPTPISCRVTGRPAIETGWVRVVVSGEVFGPLAALWPNRWDQVYASAQGPAILVAPDRANRGIVVPAQLPVC